MKEEDILQLIEKIKLRQMTNQNKEVINSLFFSYPRIIPKKMDCIIVLAGNNLSRIKSAIRIYFKHPCLIVISGGSLYRGLKKECNYYYDYAIKHGVSRKDIICEGNSTNTYQNILYSFQILQINNFSHKSILIVSGNQHLYRVQKTVNKIFSEYQFVFNISYYPAHSWGYKQNSWLLYPSVQKEVSNELQRLITYHLWDN